MYELPIAAEVVRRAMLRDRRPDPEDETPRPTASRLRRIVVTTLRSSADRLERPRPASARV